jgi:hypothetical protein
MAIKNRAWRVGAVFNARESLPWEIHDNAPKRTLGPGCGQIFLAHRSPGASRVS